MPSPPAVAQHRQFRQSLEHFALGPHDAHEVLHLLLKILLDDKRAIAAARSLERLQGPANRFLNLLLMNLAGGSFPGIFGCEFAGALAEDEKVGERIAAKSIGAVD